MNNKNLIINEINKSEALRYMGYKGNSADPVIMEMVDKDEKILLDTINPRYCYKVFDIKNNDLDDENNTSKVELEGTDLVLTGKSICKHLKGCSKAVIMCATLSDEVDKLIRKTEVNDMINTLIFDALANAAIEQLCDVVEKIVMSEFTDYNHTWRFGVGYGDLPLSTQPKLLDTLDAGKRVGVCSTESYILTPRKSVTCIIGLSKEEVDGEKSCDKCNFNDRCNLKAEGKNCQGK